MTEYVDYITLTNGKMEEVRGYRATEHTDAWLVYIFGDSTIRYPIQSVALVVTNEEPK